MTVLFDEPQRAVVRLAGLTTVLISWDALRANVTRLPDLEEQVDSVAVLLGHTRYTVVVHRIHRMPVHQERVACMPCNEARQLL